MKTPTWAVPARLGIVLLPPHIGSFFAMRFSSNGEMRICVQAAGSDPWAKMKLELDTG